jgi:hypothetical protein
MISGDDTGGRPTVTLSPEHRSVRQHHVNQLLYVTPPGRTVMCNYQINRGGKSKAGWDHRGLKGAVRKVISGFEPYEFVCRTDVKSYYASIDHQKLISKLRCFVEEYT